jgi:hypothetical protein
MHPLTLVSPPPSQPRKPAAPTDTPPDIAVAPMITVRTQHRGAGQNYYDVISETSRVVNKAGNKEGIVNNLQESIIDNRDFSGITGNICPGWDLFLMTLEDSAFIVQADDIPNSICWVFLAQAWSAEQAMEEFYKKLECRQEGLQGDMNEMVESLWEDTNDLQDDMANVMALAWANEATAIKMLQSVTSLKATAAVLVMAVNDLIPVVWHQGALLQDTQ